MVRCIRYASKKYSAMLTFFLWEVISAKIKVVVFPQGGSSNLDKWIGASTKGYTNQSKWI